MNDGNQFESSGDATEQEIIDRINEMLEISAKIPHERILDGIKAQILFAIQEKLRGILEAEFIDADIQIRNDALGGFSCTVVMESSMFSVGSKNMDDLVAILQNCAGFSVDVLDNGKLEMAFTIANAFRLLRED